MPAVGTMEIIVIIVAVVLFGPKRVPEIARQIGSAITQLRRAGDDLMKELTAEASLRHIDKPPPQGGSPPPESRPVEGKPLTSRQIRLAAGNLGIPTKGKSDEKLRSEILERIYSAQPGEPGPGQGEAG